MKNFFEKYKVPIIIVSVVVLLTAIWSPIVVIFIKNKDNNAAESEVKSAVSDLTSDQTTDNDVDPVSSDKESSESNMKDSTQSQTESKKEDSYYSNPVEDNKNNFSSQSSEKPTNTNKKPDLPELDGGAEVNESPLANTYKLLTLQKKLTIGYFGGSITGGTSAKKVIRKGAVYSEDGSLLDSYVNRVSSWFAEKFPDATIETVNSGVSDTHSQFGLYRIESTLMNTKGHDLPDLVFVEFTTNDWIYGEHTKEVVKTEVESIVLNIRKINPYADIVIIATNTSAFENSPVKQAHKEVADRYGLPYIDVGSVLQDKKTERGAASESAANNTLYYTTDNLHPSATGFSVYLQTIKPVLSKHLDGIELQSNKLYNYNDNAVTPISKNLISPTMIFADKLTCSGVATYMPGALTVSMYGTSTEKVSSVRITDSYISMKKGGTVTGTFDGNYFGILLLMSSNNVELQYSIDGGEWETFTVDSSNLSHQKYSHVQAFCLKSSLADGRHTVTIKSNGEASVNLGAILAEK